MKYLNIVVALLPSLSIAKLGETNHDRRQQANPPLVQVGLNPSFKLGRCQGDCNADSDCNSSDLFCFGRTEAFVAVPGCSGGLNDASLFDYCVRKSDLNPPLVQVGLNPSFKLERCQGDCDADSDCNSSDLVCFGRTEAFVDVPGCSGGLDDASLFDYCVRKSDLKPPVVQVGLDPKNLGRCEGDCDADSDCIGDLVCFGRTGAPFLDVPGCSGGLDDASLFDYCVRKSDLKPPVVQVGLDPKNLGRCEGDCDADSDCIGSDLVCFGRTGAPFLDVPGCSGGLDDASLFDYCVRKSDLPDPTPDPSPDPTPGPSPDPTPDPSPTPVPPVAGDVPLKYSKDFPLALCEGDCDSNYDCESGLVCFQRNANKPVPGCLGGEYDGSLTDFCIYPNDGSQPNPSPTLTPNPPLKYTKDFPLALCEGDCDNNNDCESGLVCFQRNANKPVPGCLGGENDSSLTDYCIYPNGGSQPNPSPTPPPAPVGGSVKLTYSKNFPLSLCQGDCDSNSDCRGGMVCFQRNEHDPVPGCVGGENDGSRTDYCISPTTTVVTTGDKELKSSSSFPLSECEGDCDYNDDCEEGLFCWQRGPGDDVPGCIGDDNSRVDYCIAKDNAPAKKLKLYWESSYLWQDLNVEAWWCMACTECETLTTGDGFEGGCVTPVDDKCSDGNLVWIQRCRDTMQRFEIIKNSNSGDQIRVYGTDLCFSTISNRWLELKSCDRNKSNQLWALITNLDKFELRPYSQRNLSMSVAKCLSQLHHPKATEVVALRSCKLNDDYDTNYWTEYYG